MKPQELRIGNRILGVYTDEDENGEEIEVVCECIVGTLDILDQSEYAIWVTGGAEREYYDEFRPIPLTEEHLLRFGFEREGNEFRTDWFLGLSFDVVENDFHVYEVRDSFHITTIKYVHQLQNLYFALTGEELTKTQTHN